MIHRLALSSECFSLFSFSVIVKDIYSNIWKTNKVYPSSRHIILFKNCVYFIQTFPKEYCILASSVAHVYFSFKCMQMCVCVLMFVFDFNLDICP